MVIFESNLKGARALPYQKVTQLYRGNYDIMFLFKFIYYLTMTIYDQCERPTNCYSNLTLKLR